MSIGEIRGNIIINKPSAIERQALSGLMKKDYSRKLSISINLKNLQRRIDESKFEGVHIIDILKGYFSEEILTKKECINNYKQEFELFIQYILKQNVNTYVYKYLKNSFEQRDKFYLDIKKYYNKNKEIICNELLNACKGINNLPNLNDKSKLVRIPVFASNILSNPHGFDKKTLCGKIFILLLCNVNKAQYPKSSEELAELYYQNNLLIDDISSMVLCKNILGYENGNIHKGLHGFYDYNEPVFLTLYNLANIDEIANDYKYKEVIITENPAVFMEIMEKCKIKDFPLICTYGQVKLAGILLMDLLKKGGFKLYYSGDIDPEGIQIADKLKQRYGESIKLIGFDKNIYLKNLSNITLDNNRIKKLNSIKSKQLKEVCEEVKKKQRASYEEKNINYIIEFIENLVTKQ